MGWISINRDGEILREETHGRPVQAGEEGKLLVIAQEDFGHKVAVDLNNGVIAIDYDSLGIQNGTVEIANPKLMFWICEETTIVGELAHYKAELVPQKDEKGKLVYERDSEGKKIYNKPVMVRNDILTPLTWRPIWFTRNTNGIPTKIIGAQTTLPEMQGSKNVKKLVSLFADGRIGID